MKRPLTVLLGFLLAAFSAGAALGVDVRLEQMRPSDGERKNFPFDHAMLSLSVSPPAGEWNLPSLKSEAPVFAFIELGKEKKLFILDVNGPSDTFYNRAYFDANGNRDLTDDPAVGPDDLAEPFEFSPSFPLRDVPIKVNGGDTTCSFRVYVSYRGRKGRTPSKAALTRSLTRYVTADTRYKGAFEVEGKHYRVFLGDGNGNGRFNDPPVVPDSAVLQEGAQIELGGDRILLSSEEITDFTQFMILGKYLVVGGQTFTVAIDTGKGLMTLTPVSADLAKLKLPMNVERMNLYTEKGSTCVALYNPAQEIFLPGGDYRLAAYRALRKDAQGGIWAITAAAVKESPVVWVENGKTPVFTFGEPFKVFGEVPEWSIKSVKRGRKQATINLIVKGAAEEHITDLIRLSGNGTPFPLSKIEKNRPVEAVYKIVADGGQVAVEGHFEYG